MKKFLEILNGLFLSAALVALLPLVGNAAVAPEQIVQDWAFSTPSTYGSMIALDADNNAYVAGSAPLSGQMLITKLSPAGDTLWQRIFDNAGTTEKSSWIAVDADGNAVVTGYTYRASNGDPTGLIVLKYDSAGNLLWQVITPSAFGYAARAIPDSVGGVYVLGRAFLTNTSGNTTQDIVTIKYAPDGTQQWTRALSFDNFSADSPTSMVLTPAGNVIVTGAAGGWMLMAAYDPSGNQIWTKTVEASTGAQDVAVGPAGEFYVVGGTNVFLVIKHDANFNELWRKTYSVGYYAKRVVMDSQGNAIITGVVGSYLDWMTIKLDASGNLLWSRRYDQHQANDEIPYFMAMGADDSVYITGQGGPGPTFGNVSYLRTVTAKYAPDGTQVWAATSFDSVRGLGVKLGSDNNVFVVGESPQVVFHYEQAGALNQMPTAKAAATTPTSGTAPLRVSFSSAGSADTDGTIEGYRWRFGDGTAGSLDNPTHTYAAGTYSATLAVTDNMGASATSAPITITVSESPPPPTYPPTPSSLTFNPYIVTGGKSSTATVKVTTTAGALVVLTSSNSKVATVPSSIQIPAGSSSATFTVKTSRVRTSTSVTITATVNNAYTTGTLNVVPR